VLSLLAVGGVSAVLPEMHRQTVDVHRWMTTGEFRDLYVIAQAAPGPNALVVSLIGWRVAGLAGALVATVAMCGPSCLLTYFATRAWQHFRVERWRRAVETGLAPITVGLVLATGYLLATASDAGWTGGTLTAATAILVLATRLHPLWMFAVAAGLGLAGLV
jgi:chromate transporter